jgi:hypothetical protein
LYFDFIK